MMHSIRYKIISAIFIFALILLPLLLFKLKADTDKPISKENAFIIEIEKCIGKNKKVDPVIITAMAIIESDHGTSNIALATNNLFGIKTRGPGYGSYDGGQTSIKIFDKRCDSVDYAINLLDTSKYYKEFRALRDKGFAPEKQVEGLFRYAKNPNYINILKRKIRELKWSKI